MTMAAFTEFLEILGLSPTPAKSVIGTHNTFLGLSAHFPAPENRVALAISLSPEKATHRASIIDTIIIEWHISHVLLESLIGRLGFAQTAVFGRFARAMLNPLYTKLYANRYTTSLSQALIRNLRWLGATLMNITPRIIAFNRSKPDWVLYADAAFDQGHRVPGSRQFSLRFTITHRLFTRN